MNRRSVLSAAIGVALFRWTAAHIFHRRYACGVDSRGYWEGNTLADENMHLVERLTRTKPDTILYEFRIEDPTAFTQSWAGEVPMRITEGPIYEYACYEGNYGMTGLLSGARAEEAATKTSK